MVKLKHKSLKDQKIYRFMVVSLIAVFALIAVLSYFYYIKVQEAFRTESREYLGEISKQMKINVSKNINDKFTVLETIALSLDNANISHELLQLKLAPQKELLKYENVMLADSEGNLYDYESSDGYKLSAEFLKDVIANKKNTMSVAETIKDKEYVMFAIPIENIIIDNITMAALITSYKPITFDKLLNMTAFEGKGYAHIISDDGIVIIRSSAESALNTGANILKWLNRSTIKSGKTVAEIDEDVKFGLNSGQTEFMIDGAHQYMSYIPLGTQNWTLLSFVPVSAVNNNSNVLLTLTIIACGVIALIFVVFIVILMSNYYLNQRKLENIAFVDPITKGNTIQLFYQLANKALKDAENGTYAVIYTNIEKFKVLNEEYGQKKCNQLLTGINFAVSNEIGDGECMGRLYADKFCILIKYENESNLINRFLSWRESCKYYINENGSQWLNFVMELGIYIITDTNLPLLQMIDRAKLALVDMTNEGTYDFKYATYNEKMRQVLLAEKHLEDMMVFALENNEFQVYLQPKYRTQSEKIGGAEALVRWISKTDGMIYPDSFIPIFEKNGFITQLDLSVFETVCQTIKKWVDAGITPHKISVNCSRTHLKDINFLNKYCEIADKYNVDHKYLELEVTETTVFENVEMLTKVINQIHDVGFGCSMDDFGSGYSSLNLIKDIPVDIIKLDKVFFNGDEKELPRTESVVGGIINISKALDIKTVAEGVEERFQVDMLKKLNCDYIQGYYFARPMAISQFELIAFGKTIDNNSRNN